MELKEQIFQIRCRIAELEGQKAAAEAELRVLYAMKCPSCQGRGQTDDKYDEGNKIVVFGKNCPDCSGTGKASGIKGY